MKMAPRRRQMSLGAYLKRVLQLNVEDNLIEHKVSFELKEEGSSPTPSPTLRKTLCAPNSCGVLDSGLDVSKNIGVQTL